MPTPGIDTVQGWQDRIMVDPAGGKIGTIVDIYLDDDTGQPEWATVTTGLFGSKQNFVPLAQAEIVGDSVQVPYDKDRVKSAPAIPS
jgi:sporulation protein YlmC with PRC-barrel domain